MSQQLPTYQPAYNPESTLPHPPPPPPSPATAQRLETPPLPSSANDTVAPLTKRTRTKTAGTSKATVDMAEGGTKGEVKSKGRGQHKNRT